MMVDAASTAVPGHRDGESGCDFGNGGGRDGDDGSAVVMIMVDAAARSCSCSSLIS